MKCHPERSEGSHRFLRFAQDKLRSLPAPQNDSREESQFGVWTYEQKRAINPEGNFNLRALNLLPQLSQKY
jgi:hypothetical protein